MNQQIINDHRPKDGRYQILGFVQGEVEFGDDGKVRVGEFWFERKRGVPPPNDFAGQVVLAKFWCDEHLIPQRIRKLILAFGEIDAYELDGPTLLITAYLEPGTGKLVVPLDQRGRYETKNNPERYYRIELDAAIGVPDFPVLPGYSYNLTGHWTGDKWALGWDSPATLMPKRKFTRDVRHVPTNLIDLALARHKKGTPPNPEKIEPVQAYVAAFRDLPEPLYVRAVAGRYDLVSGYRGLFVAKKFGLTEVPVTTRPAPEKEKSRGKKKNKKRR